LLRSLRQNLTVFLALDQEEGQRSVRGNIMIGKNRCLSLFTLFTLGLAFYGNGRGNNRLEGYFEVLEAVYDNNGEVDRFAVDFVQYDEGHHDWGVYGSLRYNSSSVIPEPSSMLLFGFSLLGAGLFKRRSSK